MEQCVKDSGFVTLGQRDESTCLVFAMAKAKALPEAFLFGRKKLNKEGSNSKVNQLQGKRKLCHISKGVDDHYKEINDLIACNSGYDDTKKVTLNRITNKSLSFKK